MYYISKEFSFDYAHRVYTQDVNPDLAGGDAENTCQNIHGHTGRIKVVLKASDLDSRGFVMDFKELGFVKTLVKDLLDHKMILGDEDPFLTGLLNLLPREGLTVVPFVPTSEKLSRWLFLVIRETLVEENLSDNVKVHSVSWSETPTSEAFYCLEDE